MADLTKLARFIADLKNGLECSEDPFDSNYFDISEHLFALGEDEHDLAAAAISCAYWKREKTLKGKGDCEG